MMYSLSKTFNLFNLALTLLSTTSLNRASVIATTTSTSSAEEEDALFNYDLEVKKGVTKVITMKSCKWLEKQRRSRRVKICDGGPEYSGGGNAAETCPVTCAEEKPVTAFLTKEELQNAVDDYCADPVAWEDHDDYDKYGPIEAWDVSNIDNTYYLFNFKLNCNPDVSSWDVSSVTDMGGMFRGASSFNQDLSSWDVSSCEFFGYVFAAAGSFDQDISSWDVSNGTTFLGMFQFANAFNQDISSWDVSNSGSFLDMFEDAESFDQDLCGWDISPGADMTDFCEGSSCGPCF